MKLKWIAATVILSLALSASAQITRNQKYDWGWSYKLEMPETGLKCEFPEKPKAIGLANGYMTAASYKDELYIAAKLEIQNAYDIACRTEAFAAELKEVYGLTISDLVWDEIRTENGNLTVSAHAEGGWARFHVDAIATEDILTIFIYSNHEKLSIPGHFFASSYSVYDIPEGDLGYLTEVKTGTRAKILEYDNGRSLVRLENSSVTIEWPDIPKLEVSHHKIEYNLEKDGAHYSTRILEVGPEVSYTFFNTFVNREQKRLNSKENHQLADDQTEITFQASTSNEVYFRKLTYNSNTETIQRFYVATENKIIIQELRTDEITTAETRFLNTFEKSIRNEYETRAFVSR